jgi:hypothetical protein
MFLGALLLAVRPSFADEAPEKKKIDFDAEVIEGINKQPMDSLNQIAEKEKKVEKPHLYPKRRKFGEENEQLIRELAGVRQ